MAHFWYLPTVPLVDALLLGVVLPLAAGPNGAMYNVNADAAAGAVAAAIGALFLVYTFSWEGTHREAVWLAIGRTGAFAVAAGCIGGLLGDWRNRADRS